MPPATETRKITINVDAGQSTAQLKAIADQLGGMNKNTKSLADSFGLLGASATSFLGGLGIQQLASFSDQIQTINNRLLALTGDQGKATELLGKLQVAARETNSSLQDTADLYTRVGIALKGAHIDTQVLIDFTKTLVNTYRLSGSSAEDAAAKVTSLSYAMQQGGLKGRELRTVLRENTELARLLKAQFGGNLLEAANNGFITTAKLMEVVYKNMGDVNSQATLLGATFSQSLVKVFDALKVSIFQLNQSLGASEGFAGAAQFAIDHMSDIVSILTVIGAVTIPALIPQVVRLAASFGLLSEPVLLVTALAAALLSTNTALEKLLSPIDRLNIAIYKLDLTFTGYINNLAKWASYLPGAAGAIARAIKTITDIDLKNSNQQIETLTFKAVDLNDKVKTSADGATASTDKWRKSIENAGKIKMDKTPAELLAELNAQFNAGTVSVEQYNSKLQKVSLEQVKKEFRTGHADLEKLKEGFDKFSITNLNLQLKDGEITFQQYDDAIRRIDLEKLNRQLEAGAISLEQYNHQLAGVASQFSATGAFRTGLQDYVTAIGTSTQQVAQLITHTFTNLEDQLFQFVKTGKFNFEQFTQSVLDDLLKIIIRMEIVAPIAKGLLGLASYSSSGANGAGESTTDVSGYAARGAVFDGSVAKFASGGIVTAPTMFKYGSGSTGVMGEAGPEAIVPLSRGADGKLGVGASVTPVTINIINQSGNEVQQKDSTGPNGEKQIEILITSKVREGMAKGSYDKIFKSAYGLSRKGT